MTGKCHDYREQLALALAGELSSENRKLLESHLAGCSECTAEKLELERTLGILASLEQRETPRHFFVYEDVSRPSPWSLFRSLSWGWKGALAAAALLVLTTGVAALSSLQVRFSDGTMTLSFGTLPPVVQPIEAESLVSDFSRMMEARLEERDQQWLDVLRQQVSVAVSDSENRGQNRMEVRAEEVRSFCMQQLDRRVLAVEAGLQDSILRTYRTLYTQHDLDMQHLNDRVDLVSVANRLQGSQTQALTSTVLQFANLQGRQ